MSIWAVMVLRDDPDVIDVPVTETTAYLSAESKAAVDRIVIIFDEDERYEFLRTETGTWSADGVTEESEAQSINITMGQLLDAQVIELVSVDATLDLLGLEQPQLVIQFFNRSNFVQVAELNIGYETETATGYYTLDSTTQSVSIVRLPDLALVLQR